MALARNVRTAANTQRADNARRNNAGHDALDEKTEARALPVTAATSDVARLKGGELPAWQRVLGNQAVGRLLQGSAGPSRHRSAKPAARPPATGQAGWGAKSSSTRTNPFTRRDAPARSQGPMVPGLAQRYVTSAGFSLLGNKVEFESTNLSATLPGALKMNKDGTNLDLGGNDYNATGTVKATGPKEHVKNYELGFLQTVYDSIRTFYYQPDAYNPGLLEQIGTAVAPQIFSERYKVSDTLTTLPIRDGDTGVVPWYGSETVSPYDEAATSTKTSAMYDQPSTNFPWKKTIDGTDQYLVKTGGQDVFRSWLSVQEKGTDGFLGMHRLGHIDWKVDYGTDVVVNKGNPAASTVTPSTGISSILGTSEGPGAKLPLMGDPTANDATTEIEGSW